MPETKASLFACALIKIKGIERPTSPSGLGCVKTLWRAHSRAPRILTARYDDGRFLVSGPSIPPTGGILIARAQSLDELHEFLADEPYCKAKVMRFSKITEFNPVQHQPILKDWFGAR
jgi:uncharacterized protein YciI